MNNLGFYQNGWFQTFKGRIYGNKPTDIHSRINNKAIIENNIVRPNRHAEDYRKPLEEAKPRRTRS